MAEWAGGSGTGGAGLIWVCTDMDDGGPSATARRVAAYRLGFTRIPAPYGDPAADQALAADVAAGQEPSAGGMREYLAGRTRFFDTVVTRAIGQGLDQIVVGAAGYDGRAFRYGKRGVRWFEVDHPATQRDKRERLARLGIAAGQVRFVEADFTRDPVAERLLAAGLDPARPGLFLLEGVAVYLEAAVLEAVLGQFRQVARAGSRLAISVSLSDPGQARSRFRDTVASLGEPARSTLEADEAEHLLARTGWRVTTAGGLDDPEAAARQERLRSAGLLAAQPAPRPRFPARPVPVTPTQPAAPAEAPLSLSALLSQALVAFTIEFDNEGEHQAPHRTTNYGAPSHGDGAWLVSMVMWENCMRFVTDEPITVAELLTRARTGTNLDGMRRWGYITIDGTARKIHHGHPGPGAVLRATTRGLRAREVWLPLTGLIEQRWRHRFGAGQVGLLREALAAVAGLLDPGLPDRLPILGLELRSHGPDPALPPRPRPARHRRAAPAGPAGPGAAVVRAGIRAGIRAVPGRQREPAPRPGPGRHPAARPARADRHLQGGRQLDPGRPDQGPPRRRGARPGRQPREGGPPDRPRPGRAAHAP